MGKIISYIIAWISKKALWGVIYYSLATVYFLSMVAMITAFFVALDFFIQEIRVLISMMSSYDGGSDLVAKVYGVLNCVGITQAINDVSPLFSSALVFLVARVLIQQVNRFYKNIFGIVSSIMKTGV
ncbi:MAG: hypothetical protein OQK48_07865 [Sulfurimonas sp.]|uniref:hypothetical protein n=1 Tax=Sulfurimonas sp. TaxID=2022749 RepID=UPI00261281F1|nr:hypothetical protein [Sulfurimonas sp.]MCW8895190.1 hypothetical protein [Sulfurimonas sp.]MCW8954849.1 hypothetical protein [Sulfurimonas sp.]MCW9068444.1 hypothetical protein [Sulfurimonas sp.]